MSIGVVRDKDNLFSVLQTFKKGIVVEDGATIDTATITTLNVTAINKTPTAVSAAFSPTAGNDYLADTSSSAYAATLPASPSAGDTIRIYDAGITFNTNNLSLNPNGQKINNASGTIAINQSGVCITLIFRSTSFGWYLHVA